MSISIRHREYPHENLLLDDLEGEQWEDIPGLDGYFLVSNYGRIKRQQYETQYKNGSIYVKPEKIIKQAIGKAVNHFKNDFTYYLTVKVVLSGTYYSFSIPRIIYYCFVEPFDMDDLSIVILCKDTDNLNIRPSNLVKTTRYEKQQRVIARKRYRNHLPDLTEEARLKNRKAILQAVSKQVTQYALDGRKITTYNSLSEAQRATGAFVTDIGRVANGKQRTAGGFIWRWGNEEKVSEETLRQDKGKTSRIKAE